MRDKDKIRAEVERLQKELIQEKKKGFGSDADDACILELQNVLTYIDSLQEEPISSVWRKPIETPKEGSAIVSVTDSCSFLEDDAFFLERYIPNWKGFTKEYNITRWAYKHDLMDKL